MFFEKKVLDYSQKNIPIPPEKSYIKTLIHKTENFIKRLRWKVFFFENEENDENDETVSKTFGFKTERTPPQHKDLTPFENDLFDIIANTTFQNTTTPFQKKLSKDLKDICTSQNVFIPADKTNNIYEVDNNTHNKLLQENITQHYKKTDTTTEEQINSEAKNITKDLRIADRVESIAHNNAFITLKDHKDNFQNQPKCRLINPAKTEIGIISKHYLQEINNTIRQQTKLTQWRNTTETLQWFHTLENKPSLRFIQLDIVDFYPSISQTLYNNAITFAKNKTDITPEQLHTIAHARKSLLFNHDQPWTKQQGLFDVTMGAYDGAEICELVGLYLLQEMRNRFPDLNIGLYRDDALGCHKRTSGTQTEKNKKALIKLFKENGLNITIETNLQQVNFLDATLCLPTETYTPYRKPNNNPLYINIHSNHPPTTLKQLPTMIADRLSSISSNEAIFNQNKDDYERALRKSGHQHKLNYNKNTNTPKRTKNRNRNQARR